MLEEKGFIARTRHAEDKRVWTIILDKLGVESTDEISEHIREMFEVFSNHHTDEELERLLGLLREYTDYYNESLKKK